MPKITLCTENPGDPIPGSKLLRWYCDVCGEAMRVRPENCPPAGPGRCCERCWGPTEADKIQRIIRQPGRPAPMEDTSSWQDNAIRIMEGD